MLLYEVIFQTMRVKITFLKAQQSIQTVPLHHQKLVSSFVEFVSSQIGMKPDYYNFSSLKGTSKVQNGLMRFISTRISLVISSSDEKFIRAFSDWVNMQPMVHVGKLKLLPRGYQVIAAPDFATEMKYVCISPIVIADPEQNPDTAQLVYSPSSQEFSDHLYNTMMDRLEKFGFSEDELNQFAEFEAIPDAGYIQKLDEIGKKYARSYKNNNDVAMTGYLIPFTLHAHPKVHQFIWDCGLGALTRQGYGMIDVVRDEAVAENNAVEQEHNN